MGDGQTSSKTTSFRVFPSRERMETLPQTPERKIFTVATDMVMTSRRSVDYIVVGPHHIPWGGNSQ